MLDATKRVHAKSAQQQRTALLHDVRRRFHRTDKPKHSDRVGGRRWVKRLPLLALGQRGAPPRGSGGTRRGPGPEHTSNAAAPVTWATASADRTNTFDVSQSSGADSSQPHVVRMFDRGVASFSASVTASAGGPDENAVGGGVGGVGTGGGGVGDDKADVNRPWRHSMDAGRGRPLRPSLTFGPPTTGATPLKRGSISGEGTTVSPLRRTSSGGHAQGTPIRWGSSAMLADALAAAVRVVSERLRGSDMGSARAPRRWSFGHATDALHITAAARPPRRASLSYVGDGDGDGEGEGDGAGEGPRRRASCPAVLHSW